MHRELDKALAAINVLPPTYEPGATGHILEMVELITALIAKGHAYPAEDGSGDVYFDVRSWPAYGELTNQGLDDMEPAEDADPRGKRDPATSHCGRAGRRTPSPRPPPGPAPGAGSSGVAHRVLGDGRQVPRPRLRHPRRRRRPAVPAPRERAGPVAGGGAPFASYWLHNAWITTSGEKMSKRSATRCSSRRCSSGCAASSCATTSSRPTTARTSSSPSRRSTRRPPASAGSRTSSTARPPYRPRRAADVDDPARRPGGGVAARGLRRRDGRRPRYAGRGRGPLRHRPRGQQAADRRPVGRPHHRGPPGGGDARRARSRPARPRVADRRRLRRPVDRGGRRPRPGAAHPARRRAGSQGLGPRRPDP